MPKGYSKNGVNKGWFKKGRISLKWMLGKKHNLESKEKISESLKKLYASGERKVSNNFTHAWLGKKRSIEDRLKMSLAKLGKTGEFSNNWKGGKTTGQKERLLKKYRDWRDKIYRRDSWKCKVSNKDCRGKIEAHHILRWTDYPELRYELNNGITLCRSHHPRKKSEEEKLSPYFKDLINYLVVG